MPKLYMMIKVKDYVFGYVRKQRRNR